MSQTEQRDTGIPTRAIHEAYLALQQAHRQFRRARDAGEDTNAYQREFQDAVVTFYELIRPHLKHETSLSDYWEGKIPDYTGWEFASAEAAQRYVLEKGTGVYQAQKHTDIIEFKEATLTDGGERGYAEWHDAIGLSWDSERLVKAQPLDLPGRYYVSVLRIAVLPLRELDHWKGRVIRERTSGDGFMAGETAERERHEFEHPQKLVAAKRLLVEAADKLGALSEFDASAQRTEITREDIQKVEEWRQKQLNQ